jgi:hypothetical protein
MPARIEFLLAVCAIPLPGSADEGTPDRPKAQVAFHWLEDQPIPGVTEDEGIRTTCGEELSYLHTEAILTGRDVARTELKEHDFSSAGLPGKMYTVDLHLTPAARERLAAVAGNGQKWLAVMVDGAYQGAWVFEKTQSATFKPMAGFLSSREAAERIVEGCRVAVRPAVRPGRPRCR